jgi:pimeloyl-ACP methyl ester carboxylesterase
MTASVPTLFIPGLALSPRLYAEQLPAAWRLGPVGVADHTRDDSMASIARRVLNTAPARFALVGLSMGGYVAFEIMRQAPERVTRLGLLDTTARPDTIEQTAKRKEMIALAQNGRFSEVPDLLFPRLVHKDHVGDEQLRGLVRLMAVETGAEAFVRQQTAIMTRPDSRPTLAAVACPTLVVVGDGDELTPPDLAREIASGVRGARLAIVPDAGHLSTLEQPAHVARLLGDWLQG